MLGEVLCSTASILIPNTFIPQIYNKFLNMQKIDIKNGKEIEKLSRFFLEKEVLFKERTKFKVLEVYIDGK